MALIAPIGAEDLPIEEGLTKVKDVVQELCTRIIELEMRAVPPKEIAAGKEVTDHAIAGLEAAEALCQEKSAQDLQIGNEWLEDEELKAASDKVKGVQ